ncbi:MAG: flagellar type III secretion system pore protein FliP, partial [Planctomycetota bacterium]
MIVRLLAVVLGVMLASPAYAQVEDIVGPPSPFVLSPRTPEPLVGPDSFRGLEGGAGTGINPMRLLGDAARLIPQSGGVYAGPDYYAPGGSNGGVLGPEPGPPAAAPERGGLSVAINIMILLTVLTLVPSVMLMMTSFVRILIVLGLLKQALGTQSVPPAQILTGLAMFMTAMVMAPTVERVFDEAITPWQNGEIRDYEELWDRAKQPMRDFMFDQIEATGNWSSVYMIMNYRGIDTSEPETLVRADVDMVTLVPAYMLSELKLGFLMGFRVYLPFLVVDMVIATVLISMSMMMLPPVLISLPFKIMLFVLADGWQLVVGSIMESFVQDGQSARVTSEAALWLLA